MNQSYPAFKFKDNHPAEADFKAEALAGLTAAQKSISPKFFYDEAGSRLFDAICATPEYYPTRTETAIIRDNVSSIASALGRGCLLVEPGSGNSAKVRVLLDALKPHTYLPMDISKAFLQKEAARLAAEFPWLNVHAVCSDFTQSLELPVERSGVRSIAFFPGSSIGNFEPEHAQAFLGRIGAMVGPRGGLLIGIDLKKDPVVLNAAYNDRTGVTAAFNKNMLTRMNRELGANFELGRFDHRAFYNASRGRIEMHLESKCAQQVTVAGALIDFRAGETIHSENSYKYTVGEFSALAAGAGFDAHATWTDRDGWFALMYFSAVAR